MKGKAYSIDLRERVVARVEAGESVRSVGKLFAVSVSCVVKWSQLRRRTGSVAPGRQGNHRRPVLLPHRDWIKARFEAEPHLTLRGLQAELFERFGVKIDYRAVWNFVRKEGLSFKKKRSAYGAGPAGRRPATGSMEEISDAG